MKLLKKTAIVLAATFTFGSGMSIVPPAQAQAKTRYVYIAVKYGKKYHYKRHCRGLNAAHKVKKFTLKWAKKHHYTLCKWG